EPPLAFRARSAEPFGVANDHAPRVAGPDRIEPRPENTGRVPLEQRRILRRTLVDVGLVLRGRGLLLLHAPPDEYAVAIDAEPVQRRPFGRPEAVDAFDHLRARVEEELVDLGDREVLLDGDAHVEALNRERKARRPLLAGLARAHRP